MEIELVEVRDFLAHHSPFDQLPSPVLEQLPRSISIRYLRRGTAFPPQDTQDAFLYLICTGAVELRHQDAVLIDKLAEGDLYAASCLPNDFTHLIGITVEDTLLYLLPCAHFNKLCQEHPQFKHHFTASAHARIRQARQQDTLLQLKVSELISRKPISVPPQTSIRQTAQIMSQERVSAMLILDQGTLCGIVTDRDLRNRCLAAGMDPEQPIADIMTTTLTQIAPNTPAFEALIQMTRYNIHHLPVVGQKGVEGLITDTDFMRYQSTHSIYLVGDIDRAHQLSDLEDIGKRLPELQAHLIKNGASVQHLGQAMAAITDALTAQLIRFYQAEHGTEPIPFTWLAIGAHARYEQTAYSDQDHALLLDDRFDSSQHQEYFTQLCHSVTDGLSHCHFAPCPGETMATNPKWRQPSDVWQRYFSNWIEHPDRHALMLACNFFDARPIAGQQALWQQLQQKILSQAQDNQIFQAHLAVQALSQRPPLGFFRNFVLIHDGQHDETVNLKQQGIMPIIALARLFALATGCAELNTLDRLHAAAETGLISRVGAEGLADAFEFIGQLRARHQIEQAQQGMKVDHYLCPKDLTHLERKHLKDAFATIAQMQEIIAQRYQTERFF